MARDPLRILLTVRQRAVEEARIALGACLRAEAEVSDAIRLLDDAVRQDLATSRSWPDAYRFLEISANRQGAVRAQREMAAAALAAAMARTEDARGVVTEARTAAAAVEELIDERAAASELEAGRREQHVLDDIARARRGAGKRGPTG